MLLFCFFLSRSCGNSSSKMTTHLLWVSCSRYSCIHFRPFTIEEPHSEVTQFVCPCRSTCRCPETAFGPWWCQQRKMLSSVSSPVCIKVGTNYKLKQTRFLLKSPRVHKWKNMPDRWLYHWPIILHYSVWIYVMGHAYLKGVNLNAHQLFPVLLFWLSGLPERVAGHGNNDRCFYP